jgi:uncharacterized protein (DUF2062 family)
MLPFGWLAHRSVSIADPALGLWLVAASRTCVAGIAVGVFLSSDARPMARHAAIRNAHSSNSSGTGVSGFGDTSFTSPLTVL